MKKQFLLFSLLLASLAIAAQSVNTAKLDSLFQRIDENDQGMGSISIFKNGNEVYQSTFGYANIEEELPADALTKYRIGSISKTFTAVIVMQLIDEKHLMLDTKLDKFFRLLPNADKITIRQLLGHRSGLYNYTDNPEYGQWCYEPQSREQMLLRVKEGGVVFEPDEKAEYSNTNYLLLSYIAEEITGQRYDVLLQQRIAKPCGLQNTYFGGTTDSDRNEAFSYARASRWELVPETSTSAAMGAGGVVSTPAGLNRFMICLFTGTLISDSARQQMMNIRDGYGLGLFTYPFFERKAYGHTGGIDGFQSMAAYFPDDEVAVAYTTNAVSMPRNDILIGALSIFFDKDYQLPVFSAALTLPPEKLDRYTGIYSSDDIPLKITISREDNTLMAQATGQPAFPLTATGEHQFGFVPAGIVIRFNPEANEMTLLQSGGVYTFQRE
jgi:CubicO group peptidase (beta-lactamase class C family)